MPASAGSLVVKSGWGIGVLLVQPKNQPRSNHILGTLGEALSPMTTSGTPAGSTKAPLIGAVVGGYRPDGGGVCARIPPAPLMASAAASNMRRFFMTSSST